MSHKRTISIIFALTIICSSLFSAFNPAYSDYQFYNKQDYSTDRAYLDAALSESKDEKEKAEILWRLSRNILTVTDGIEDKKENKDARLEGYSKAEELARESSGIADSADASHWIASAIGRIGQVNGPMNSLGKAKPMLRIIEHVQNDLNANKSDSWYVLGLLYNQLPGGISFGDDDKAISYMRICIDTQDEVNRTNLTNYLELANQLYDRNWDKGKRSKEFEKMRKKYSSESVPTEKAAYYEGKDGKDGKAKWSTLALGAMSDRQEAVTILKYAMMIYEVRGTNVLPSDTKLYGEIKDRLGEMT